MHAKHSKDVPMSGDRLQIPAGAQVDALVKEQTLGFLKACMSGGTDAMSVMVEKKEPKTRIEGR